MVRAFDHKHPRGPLRTWILAYDQPISILINSATTKILDRHKEIMRIREVDKSNEMVEVISTPGILESCNFLFIFLWQTSSATEFLKGLLWVPTTSCDVKLLRVYGLKGLRCHFHTSPSTLRKFDSKFRTSMVWHDWEGGLH